MKLSQLITYKHMVDNLHVNHIYDQIDELLTHVRTDLDVKHIDFDNIKASISLESKQILDRLSLIQRNLDEFKRHLSEFVTDVEKPYYDKSMEIYREGENDDADYVLDRHNFKKLLYQTSTRDFFLERVKGYSNWKWPALEIRPAFGEISDAMVACDPVYFVDTHQGLFREVEKKWTPEYQKRLRYYVIDETAKKIYQQLPALQLGLIVAVDFFNFRPLPIIKKHLAELFGLLRPGGLLMFTYNNCDYPIGVDNFENSYYCYTPGTEIKTMCKEIGFRTTASFDLENNVSWLELQRPGTLTSLKGGQTLGRIENI
jgi:SAM-dependent methyltransferase